MFKIGDKVYWFEIDSDRYDQVSVWIMSGTIASNRGSFDCYECKPDDGVSRPIWHANIFSDKAYCVLRSREALEARKKSAMRAYNAAIKSI